MNSKVQIRSILASLWAMVLTGRKPSRRAVAAVAKLSGRALTRRWPYLPKLAEGNCDLEFVDLLELQYARTRNFLALVIGAFDGITNDPTSEFLRNRHCSAILVEPQPQAFKRLQKNMASRSNMTLVNAAIDQTSGSREMYCVSDVAGQLPTWTEQLASFRRDHIIGHEEIAPGLSNYITPCKVATLSFDDLLDTFSVKSIDVLQIDAEGMDGQLLRYFPFGRVKPALVHYEITHMSADERQYLRDRLADLGYLVRNSGLMDEMAILF
jgi:FkbM family methyltransferase